MQLLWHYLRPYRSLIVLALLLAGASQILDLFDPIIFGRIIDGYVLNPSQLPESQLVQGVLTLLAIAVAVAFGARFAKVLQDYVPQLVVQRSGMQLFNDGLRQALRLSYQEYEDSSSGSTVSLLQKIRGDTERFINGAVNTLFSTLVGIAFLVWYSITKHWLLIPVFLIGVVVLGGLTGILSQRIKRLQRAIVRETSKMYGTITESLRNIELVKSLGLANSEARRLQKYTQAIFDLEMDKTRRTRTLSLMQGTVINILKQSILFVLLWLIFRNVLSAGELISTQVILNTMFGPLQQLSGFILQYREAEASLQSFEQLMNRPVETRPEEPVDIGQLEQIRFEDVTFRHRNASENAIDHLTFEARLGDTIAFVGPSGSGKSTLVKLLVGLYTPNSGVISIDNVPVRELRYNRIRRQIGFVTQDPQMFSGTIRDNLQWVKPGAADEEMMEALGKAAALQLMERTGQGLDTRLGEGGTRVSGGERQRLSIARALLRKPRLFIFDEATSALDSLTEREITDAVRQVSASREHIVILIAHRLSTIMHADTIYVLERGRIVEQGTHQELLDRLGLYYAMWRQQIGERAVQKFQTPPSTLPIREQAVLELTDTQAADANP